MRKSNEMYNGLSIFDLYCPVFIAPSVFSNFYLKKK